MRIQRDPIPTRVLLGAVLLVAVLLTPIAVSLRRTQLAAVELSAAHTQLASVQRDAARILDLRSRRQQVEDRYRPQQNLNDRLLTAMGAAGIPATHLTAVTPEGDRPVADPRGGATPYHRQSIRVTLDGLTVSRLGDLLIVWHDTEPLWTPTRIDLVHGRTARRGADDETYSVTLILTATYVDQS